MDSPDRKSNTATWIVIYIAIVMATTALGLVAGGLYHRMTPVTFRSDAAFRLVEHPVLLGTEPTPEHDQRISQPEFVDSVLKSNQLYESECFTDSTQEQALQDTLANLEVTQNSKESSIYEVSLRSRNAKDAQTIVTNLIAEYAKELEQTKISPQKPAPADSSIQPDPDVAPKDLAEFEFAKEIQNSGQAQARNLQLLQPATRGEKVWPNLPLILGVTGTLGLLAGFAFVVLIFSISRRMEPQSGSTA